MWTKIRSTKQQNQISPSVKFLGNVLSVISLLSAGHVKVHGLPSKSKMGNFPSSKVPSAQVILHGLICEGNANKEQPAVSFQSLHVFINRNKLGKKNNLCLLEIYFESLNLWKVFSYHLKLLTGRAQLQQSLEKNWEAKLGICITCKDRKGEGKTVGGVIYCSMTEMWLHFMITRQFGWNFETWLLRMSKQQQNVKKVQGTKKIRKTGRREPKFVLLQGSAQWLTWGTHALQTEVEQHSTDLTMNI